MKELCFYHNLKLRYSHVNLGTILVSYLVTEDTCVIWFLVVYSKTIHCTLILNTDLENSGKTMLEK